MSQQEARTMDLQDWKRGDRLWVMEVHRSERWSRRYGRDVFPKREIRMLVTGIDGAQTVRRV